MQIRVRHDMLKPLRAAYWTEFRNLAKDPKFNPFTDGRYADFIKPHGEAWAVYLSVVGHYQKIPKGGDAATAIYAEWLSRFRHNYREKFSALGLSAGMHRPCGPVGPHMPRVKSRKNKKRAREQEEEEEADKVLSFFHVMPTSPYTT
jgi:hypothetical protein